MSAVRDAIVGYTAVAEGYRRQLALLAHAEPDLDALLALARDIDARLAELPAAAQLQPPAASAGRLLAAAQAAEAARAQVCQRLQERRDELGLDRGRMERGARALKSYIAPPSGPARYCDAEG